MAGHGILSAILTPAAVVIGVFAPQHAGALAQQIPEDLEVNMKIEAGVELEGFGRMFADIILTTGSSVQTVRVPDTGFDPPTVLSGDARQVGDDVLVFVHAFEGGNEYRESRFGSRASFEFINHSQRDYVVAIRFDIDFDVDGSGAEQAKALLVVHRNLFSPWFFSEDCEVSIHMLFSECAIVMGDGSDKLNRVVVLTLPLHPGAPLYIFADLSANVSVDGVGDSNARILTTMALDSLSPSSGTRRSPASGGGRRPRVSPCRGGGGSLPC